MVYYGSGPVSCFVVAFLASEFSIFDFTGLGCIVVKFVIDKLFLKLFVLLLFTVISQCDRISQNIVEYGIVSYWEIEYLFNMLIWSKQDV